jgi:hypothetical protein
MYPQSGLMAVTATETYLAVNPLVYATVPAGATTGRIQVVAQDGSALSAASFSVAADFIKMGQVEQEQQLHG